MSEKMKWVIKSKHRKHGYSFYFVKLKVVDGIIKPVNCHRNSASERAAVFSSIAEAYAVIRQVTSKNWNFIICPMPSCFRYRFRSMEGGAR